VLLTARDVEQDLAKLSFKQSIEDQGAISLSDGVEKGDTGRVVLLGRQEGIDNNRRVKQDGFRGFPTWRLKRFDAARQRRTTALAHGYLERRDLGRSTVTAVFTRVVARPTAALRFLALLNRGAFDSK
jgi:hypothetical protein